MEQHIESSGKGRDVPKPTTLTLNPTSFPEFDGEFLSGQRDEEQAQNRYKVAFSDRQLTASGRDAKEMLQ